MLAAITFRGPKAEKDLALLRDRDLYAPILLAYELTSIAYKKSPGYPQDCATLSESLECGSLPRTSTGWTLTIRAFCEWRWTLGLPPMTPCISTSHGLSTRSS